MYEEENNNLKRHPHADVIHAWAEGQEVQFLCRNGKWVTIRTPEWSRYTKYRIKPKTKEISFRNVLIRFNNHIEAGMVFTDVQADYCENESGMFVKWLGPWQKVEVED